MRPAFPRPLKDRSLDLEAALERALQRYLPQQPPLVEQTRWMSAAEAAQYMGVSRSTLTRWRKAGVVETHRIGRRVFFRASDLDRAVKAGG